MANTYSCGVNNMTCVPAIGRRDNVVIEVLWTCSGTDGKQNAAYTSSTPVVYAPKALFIPYEKLTLDDVMGWVYKVIGDDGMAAIEALVDEEITAQATPPFVTPPLPWG